TQLINGYGPTEGTTFTCCYRIPRDLSAAQGSIPIGRPIGNTSVYLLDEHLRLVPVGEPGELFVGGAGLARGYWDAPKLTAAKFVVDPLGVDPGGRLYRTGDLARWRPDGHLEFLGRLDDQVKIRGFRIELGEIAAALVAQPVVEDAIVIKDERPTGGCLVAYIIPDRQQ